MHEDLLQIPAVDPLAAHGTLDEVHPVVLFCPVVVMILHL